MKESLQGLFPRNHELEKQAKSYSIIHWQTGEPEGMCTCLVTIIGGTIEVADWNGSEWDSWLEDSIIAWCKLSDIKPYKEKEEQP